jgi:hypothetical protein
MLLNFVSLKETELPAFTRSKAGRLWAALYSQLDVMKPGENVRVNLPNKLQAERARSAVCSNHGRPKANQKKFDTHVIVLKDGTADLYILAK